MMTPAILPHLIYIALGAIVLAWAIVRMIGVPWIGRASRIVDGDSVEARAWFNDYRIRIRGIDAPEYTQEYGKEARRALASLIGSSRALFIPFGADKHGRLLCWIICARGPVSWIMAWRGHAWPESIATRILHVPARLFRRGLWASSVRLHPSGWRRYGQRMESYVPRSPPQNLQKKSGRSSTRR